MADDAVRAAEEQGGDDMNASHVRVASSSDRRAAVQDKRADEIVDICFGSGGGGGWKDGGGVGGAGGPGGAGKRRRETYF